MFAVNKKLSTQRVILYQLDQKLNDNTDMTTDISHVIQLAVAPVFLLAGIGAFVNAFAGRLGRIFDRSRSLEAKLAVCEPDQQQAIKAELKSLGIRSRLAYTGIALDIVAALLVCVLIAVAFAGYFFGYEIRALIAGLFIAAMLSLIGGLLAFLREIFIAVRNLSISMPRPAKTGSENNKG
jgi:MFS family permease